MTKRKKGDTLVEVAFAIGIFSLVAVITVSVVSASTSAAQAALETTLTREDIDSQAEALRFIHDSYVNGSQSAVQYADNKYEKLWKEITKLAYDDNNTYSNSYPEAGLQNKSIKQYNVTACSNLYNGLNLLNLVNNPGTRTPFIIDIRNLSLTDKPEKIIVKGTSSNKFMAAVTYPRILYENGVSEDLYTQAQGGNNNIYRVEGLYIIAVKGKASVITGKTNSTSVSDDKKDAYYDFYIRSCWMPTNIDRASTVSTMVRLYDPAIVH